MNDDFMNDQEFDQWLRKEAGTGGRQAAADGWDNPPEHVWSGLRAGIDQQKKKRRWLIWSTFALLFMVTAFGVLYWSNSVLSHSPAKQAISPNTQQTQQNPNPAPQPAQQLLTLQTTKQAQTKPHPTPGKQEAVKTQKTALPAQPNPKRDQSIAVQVRNKELSKDLPGNSTASIVNKDQESQPTVTTSVSTQIDKRQTQEIPAPLHSTPTVQEVSTGKTAGLQTAVPTTTKQIVEIPLLPSLNNMMLDLPKRTIEKPTVVPSPTKPVRSTQRSIQVSAVSGPMFTRSAVRNKNGSVPNGLESGSWTWQHGAQIGIGLSEHWTLETGIQLAGICLQAERTINFQYRTNLEQFNQQDFLYTNSDLQTIETSFGVVEMRMNIGREPNRPITDQAAVQLKLRTEEKVRYIRFPVRVHWQQKSRNWQWGLYGGFGLNLEAGYDLKLTAARTDRPGVRNIRARTQQRAAGLAPMVLDAEIGLQGAWQVTPGFALTVSPTLRHSLSSMYKNGPFRSLAVTGGVQAGFRINLNQ